MYPYSEEEALQCLISAPNLNAAAKRFLKNEGASGDDNIRFGKAFRNAAKNPKEKQLREFVQKALPKYEQQLFLIVKYAYDEAFTEIVEQIFERYAEQFNDTYEIDGEQISLTDEARFHEISQKAIAEIDELIETRPTPNNNCMRNAVCITLFEPLVLKQIRFPA